MSRSESRLPKDREFRERLHDHLSIYVGCGFVDLISKHRSAISGGFLLRAMLNDEIPDQHSQRDIDVYCLIDDYLAWGCDLFDLGYQVRDETIYGNRTSSVKWTPTDSSKYILDFHIILEGEHSVVKEFRRPVDDEEEAGNLIYQEISRFDLSCCMNMYYLGEIYSPYWEMTRQRNAYYFRDCQGSSIERINKYMDMGFTISTARQGVKRRTSEKCLIYKNELEVGQKYLLCTKRCEHVMDYDFMVRWKQGQRAISFKCVYCGGHVGETVYEQV